MSHNISVAVPLWLLLDVRRHVREGPNSITPQQAENIIRATSRLLISAIESCPEGVFTTPGYVYSALESSDNVRYVPRVEKGELITVNVKQLTGKSFDIRLGGDSNGEDLATRVEEKEGIPLDQQVLIARGQEVWDSREHPTTVRMLKEVCSEFDLSSTYG